MLIRAGYELTFHFPSPATMLLMLYTHPSRKASLREPENLRVTPQAPVELFTDHFGNTAGRVSPPPGTITFTNDFVVEDSGAPDEQNPFAIQHAVEGLPAETLVYLLNSRYCEVDAMSPVAWDLFGRTLFGWARVQAICDWCHDHVTFDYAAARPTKTAQDVFHERRGGVVEAHAQCQVRKELRAFHAQLRFARQDARASHVHFRPIQPRR